MCKAKIYTCRGNVTGFLILFFFLMALIKNASAQPVLSLNPVITTGLSSPIQFVNAGDGSNRVFIVEQGGTIRAYDAAFNFLSVFVTVSGVNAGGEQGLLSMAFHPGYQGNGLFYVYYTNTDGDLELARYQVSDDPNVADDASKVVLKTIPHPVNANHNGGELHFGIDGYLYLSTGDGGGGGDIPNNAQNTSVLLGKMLRFDVNTSATPPYYSIPAGNPFGNEIFDLGLRNPFRWSFDRQTGDMWIGDVGQNAYEEINFRAAGSTGGVNYGWHCYEGNNDYNTTGCGPASDYVFPVYTYPNQSPSAVTGGIVYRGTAYPALQGYNISADFYSGVFYTTISNGSGGWITSTQTLSPNGIADFGETEDGEAYAVSLTGNSVYRILFTPPLPVSLIAFGGTVSNEGVNINWQTAREENVVQFEIEYSMDGVLFSYLGTVAAKNIATGAAYVFLHSIDYNGTISYRLKITDTDGSYKYSNIISVVMGNAVKSIVSPSVINNGVMNVKLLPLSYNSLELFSMNGSVVFKKNITGQSGNIKVNLGKLSPGIYIVRLTGNTNASSQKIIIQ
jgi:glucose/arabinose dehydrogenase